MGWIRMHLLKFRNYSRFFRMRVLWTFSVLCTKQCFLSISFMQMVVCKWILKVSKDFVSTLASSPTYFRSLKFSDFSKHWPTFTRKRSYLARLHPQTRSSRGVEFWAHNLMTLILLWKIDLTQANSRLNQLKRRQLTTSMSISLLRLLRWLPLK